MIDSVMYEAADGEQTTVEVTDHGDDGLEVSEEVYDQLASLWADDDSKQMRTALWDEAAEAWVYAWHESGQGIIIELWHNAGAGDEIWLHESPIRHELLTTCRLCRGSGRVAVGPWGSRPPRETCRECGGKGQVSLEHAYDDPTI
jgi:hypothetical protein